ncbi:gamma-glutamyltranspeptidase [Powellomyces hirtus]|nr:gamma-glutamyltranspeptidase [Powellomyces hirtus]
MIFHVHLVPVILVAASSAIAAPIHGPQGDVCHKSYRNAGSQGRAPEYPVTGNKGAVVTEVDVCSNVGVDLLKKGGSAADAAIGASLCVGSLAAFHSGIGGGGFGLIRTADGTKRMFDFRETAPAASNETMFSNNTNPTASIVGGLAVAIPGELRAWEDLHRQYGKLSWKELFKPAIELNRNGFKIGNQLSVAINAKKYPFLCADPIWREVYCPNGTAKGEGEWIRNKRYAITLDKIAKGGPDVFYNGELARTTVAAVQARGGIMTGQDLTDYVLQWRKPNNITYAGKHRVTASVAPSSGNVVLSALQTLDTFPAADFSQKTNLTAHRLVEAMKFGYGERTTFGDPDFVGNVTKLQASYLLPAYAKEKSGKILDNATHPIELYNPSNSEVLSDSGTSHISAVDSTGMAITLTTSVNTFWGSQIMTPDGIILDNTMDDFSSPLTKNYYGYVPTKANFIRPGKRPLSSMSPVIVENLETGALELATGSAGGSRIITAVLQNVYRVLASDGQLDLQQSINAPRIHNQLQPNVTSLEWAEPSIPGFQGFDNATASSLKEKGHITTYVAPGQSTAQGVQRFRNGTFLAAAEIRQLSARGAAL